MSDTVLHLLAGPNGAGKSTLYSTIIGQATQLEFVNADLISAQLWPDDPVDKSYEAAVIAAERRSEMIEHKVSFVTGTVFSHESKLQLVNAAMSAGYLVTLHVVLIPKALAVARVANRVKAGGHTVPENKIRERYWRLWPLVTSAIGLVGSATVYDNSQAGTPFRVVASFEHGCVVGGPVWPAWTPQPLRKAGR